MSLSRRDTSLNWYLSDLQHNMFFSFEGLDDFLNASNKLALKANDDISNKIDKWNLENPEHHLSVHDIYEKDFFDSLSFDTKINNASMILIYSQFEIELDHICLTVSKVKNLNILPRDLNGKGILQSKNYLVKVLNVDFSTVKDVWDTINKYRELRNEFVHRNGQLQIPENQIMTKSEIYRKLKEIKDCDISDSGSIKISIDTLKEFSKIAQKFLTDICDLLKEPNKADI